jgi:hypothetical protein
VSACHTGLSGGCAACAGSAPPRRSCGAGWADALEADLEHQRRPHAAHRGRTSPAWGADHAVDTGELLVAEARVGLREGQQLQRTGLRRLAPLDGLDHRLRLGRIGRRPAPDGEGVVGVDAGAAAVPGLGVDEHASTDSGSTFHFHQVPSALVRPLP